MTKPLPCPFCGNTDIRYSKKTSSGDRRTCVYHITAYCTKCRCYGPRTLIKAPRYSSVGDPEELLDKVYQAWNQRI